MRQPCLFIALLWSLSPASAKPAPAAQVDAIFADMAAPNVPGCAVGVARKGQTLVARAYGSADLEHSVALTPATILEAGSVSKQFTAAAVLLLVEDGKLALDADVRRYVPELPDYGRTITIDHLLSHTSGLRDWGSVAELAGWPRTTRAHTQADAVEIIRRQRSLNYQPGAEYSYTNSGYNLLTEIVKRVSGKSLADFSRERLFLPLGMSSTSWRDDHRRIVPNRAIAYARSGDRFAQEMPFEDVYGNGGLLTTVGDLLAWNAALAESRLGKRVTERLQQRAVLNDGTSIKYARGLIVTRHRGVPAIVHSGSTGGYRAWLGRYPSEDLSVALLCNRGDAQAPKLGKQIADLFLPAEPAVAAPAAHAGPDRSGLFVNSRTGQSLRLATDKGRLTIDGDAVLVAVGPDRFRDEDGDVLFVSPDRFRATDSDRQTTDYLRATPFAPSARELGLFAGHYASEEADAAYIVSPAGDGLAFQLDRRPHIKVKLKPTYADTFEGDGIIARFRRNAAGEVIAMSLGIPRVRDLSFRRVIAAPASARRGDAAGRRHDGAPR